MLHVRFDRNSLGGEMTHQDQKNPPANFRGTPPERLVVGITGASGAILGIHLLKVLQPMDIETHLVVSQAGRITIAQETDWEINDVLDLADTTYNDQDISAAIASGSFATRGMVIIPCSIKTLSAVANSYAADLISRSADVTLKEGRPLVLVVREGPLHRGHVRLLRLASEAGAIIHPPMPAFYKRPQTIDDIYKGIVGRVLLRLGIENDEYPRWKE